jgi:hypothetical protein
LIIARTGTGCQAKVLFWTSLSSLGCGIPAGKPTLNSEAEATNFNDLDPVTNAFLLIRARPLIE